MATKLGKIVADFSTSLASAMAVGATSVTLQSATDDDGIALPAGRYFFAIDGDNSQKEHISCTLSGTSLTGISSLSRQGVEASGCVRAHRVGATVTLTDFAHIKFINDLLANTTNLDSTAPLGYDGTASITTANQLATKAYVDGIAIAGSPDATTTTKGIAKASVAPASAASPIFVGDNDPRVPSTAQVGFIPTTGQKDALVGNNTDVAVGTGNKYVTQTGLQHGAEIYAADSVGTDSYAVTLSPVPTSYTNGMTVRFKAGTANTGAATLNVNALGAKTIKRTTGNDLSTGDILSGQIVEVTYDGTNFQMMSMAASGFLGITATGNTTYNLNSASGTQNIAHGLGVTPKIFNVTGIYAAATTNVTVAQSYNGSSVSFNTNATASFGAAQTSFQVMTATSGDTQTAVITADATNIILTWTKVGTPSGTLNIAWSALA